MSKELKNSFDQSIRDAIGNHQVPYDDHSWDMLEQKMAQMDMSAEESVDDKVREAVESFEIPYHSASWEILSERLDRINYRKRLIASKVFEAAVIFFAIFTMVKFLGQIPEVQELLPKSFVKQGQVEYTDERLESSTVSSDSDSQKSEFKSKSLDLTAQSTQAAELESGVKSDMTAPNSDLLKLNRLPIPRPFVNKHRPLTMAHESRTIHSTSSIQSLDLAVNVQAPALGRQQEKAEKVPMLPLYDMAMLEAETAHDFHVLAASPRSRIQTKVGVFHQNNVHLINRLVKEGRIPQQTVKSNRGLGFVANVQFGKFGFDLGGSYNKLTYEAGTGITYIEKLQIPINIRYNGLKTRYADFYAVGGASAHAVLRANYAAPVYLSAPGPTKKKRFNDGLLEDGAKIDNVYYSINGGIGVDIPVYKKFGVFIEALYQHHLKDDIGYTNDKIRTYSYNFGITTKL